MSVLKAKWLTLYPDGDPTRSPFLMDAASFDVSSRGPLFPTQDLQHGDAHIWTVDGLQYRWDAVRGKWLSDQMLEFRFAVGGADVPESVEMFLLGGETPPLPKLYPLLADMTVVGLTVLTTDAQHGGFKLQVGTLFGFLTPHWFETDLIPDGSLLAVMDDLNFDMVKTEVTNAPDTDTLGCAPTAYGGAGPDNLMVTIYACRRAANPLPPPPPPPN